MYVIINENRDYGFERKKDIWEFFWGGEWREERKECNYVIISKIKETEECKMPTPLWCVSVRCVGIA